MGKRMQFIGGSTIYVVSLPFYVTNLPDANGNALALEASSNDRPPAPWRGSIIGLSVRHNADLTGGVITWTPTIDGVANTGISVVTDDPTQQAYVSKQMDTVPFAKGARLGVAWTKTGTVAPTTTDVTIDLIVAYEDVDL